MKVLVKNTNRERAFNKTFGEIYKEQRKTKEASSELYCWCHAEATRLIERDYVSDSPEHDIGNQGYTCD